MIHTEKNTGLISVVIPVYNQARELERALASIRNQTYKDVEVIIEEDKLHEGAPVMRNRGLQKAKGEYIIFWDADLVGRPEMLEKLEKLLRAHPEASFAYCDYKLQVTRYKIQKNIKSQIFNVQTLRQNNYIHSTSLIRKKDAIKWDESLKRFQDWDLWLTMAEKGKIGVYLPETLFTITAKGTMSSWLPSFAYKTPWRWLPGVRGKVRKYEEARGVVARKHNIL